MTFWNSFLKVGIWFVRWFIEIVSIFLPDNKPAVNKPLLALSPPPKNETTAAGGIALPAIRQEGKKFRQYASTLSATVGKFAVGTVLAWKWPAMPKPVILRLTISFITSWTIIYFVTDVWMLYVARLIAGSVIFTFAFSNRTGQRVFLLISDSIMAICLGTLAYYFWLQEHGADVSSFNLIPFISLGVYISTFALGFDPIPGVMIGKLFSPEIMGLAIGIVCVLASLIEFCVVKTYQILFEAARGYELGDVEALKRRFSAVFLPLGVLDSPEACEVAVAEALRTTDARLKALEDAVTSLSVADVPRTTDDRVGVLEDAIRSLSAQFEAFAANRAQTNHAPKNHAPTNHALTNHAPTNHAPTNHAPTNHASTNRAPTNHATTNRAQQARNLTRWCYYHVRYGTNARKCGSDQCTFALMKKNPLTNHQTMK